MKCKQNTIAAAVAVVRPKRNWMIIKIIEAFECVRIIRENMLATSSKLKTITIEKRISLRPWFNYILQLGHYCYWNANRHHVIIVDNFFLVWYCSKDNITSDLCARSCMILSIWPCKFLYVNNTVDIVISTHRDTSVCANAIQGTRSYSI